MQGTRGESATTQPCLITLIFVQLKKKFFFSFFYDIQSLTFVIPLLNLRVSQNCAQTNCTWLASCTMMFDYFCQGTFGLGQTLTINHLGAWTIVFNQEPEFRPADQVCTVTILLADIFFVMEVYLLVFRPVFVLLNWQFDWIQWCDPTRILNYYTAWATVYSQILLLVECIWLLPLIA